MKLELLINAPSDKTYRLFADIKNTDKNIEAIEKIEMIDAPKTFVGTKWRETRTEFGKQATVEMWVKEASENKYYVVESFDHGVHYLSRYDFEPVAGNKTNVVFTFEGRAMTFTAKLMSAMFVLFARATKKLFLKDMQDLKKALERND